MKAVNNLFPADSVFLVDMSEDLSTWLLKIEGGATAPSYWRFDRKNLQLTKLYESYARISDTDIAPVTAIEYKATDGKIIPSIITHPRGAQLGAAPLGLIVMPHGGPEAYDAVSFDWMAQYFASRGYLVFQPNFRGSEGFGASHRDAGRGEWGGKMQDDITDGVNVLIRNRWADPDRVCIIGGSYGGYAALAGGAFSPDLYKCVAAIAPVADLPKFLSYVRDKYGRDDWVNEYWARVIGDRKDDAEKLDAISPVNSAAAFKAPVLLIHGNDDVVVPFDQSNRMEAALKRAGKEVQLVKLKNEDHWLSSSETRLQTLRELDRFVAETIGRN
jgi:dipeptidyl aminopeptidase/acylaminoacyl peptidase